MQENLFESTLNFRVDRVPSQRGKIEYDYFETEEAALESMKKEAKYYWFEFFARRNKNGKWDTIYGCRKDGRLIYCYEEEKPYNFAGEYERALNNRAWKAERMRRLGIKNIPEF